MDRRYYLPINLAGILLIFVAPWVEVRCDGVPNAPAAPMIRQSGLEAAQGTYDIPLSSMVSRMVPEVPIGNALTPLDAVRERYRPEPAPLLFGFVASVSVALLATMLMVPGIGRSVMVTTCVFVATAFLTLQSTEGLPLMRNPPTAETFGKEIAMMMNAQNGEEENPIGPIRKPRIGVRFMPPFFLTWLGMVTACALAVTEIRTRNSGSRA